MNNVAIIFIYSQKNHITSINYQSIIDHADGCDVYTSNQYNYQNYYYDFLNRLHISQWTPQQMWWSCDSLFLYWYLANMPKYKQYIIIEDDTYVNQNILEFLQIDDEWIQNHEGIASAQTKLYLDDKHYHWFQQFSNNPVIKNIYNIKSLASCSPICCTILSDNAVQDIISEIKEHPLINSVFAEIKYATILHYLKKYQLSNLHNNVKNYITYDENLCLNSIQENIRDNKIYGVFHPIKNINTINKYLKYNDINIKNNISQALIGVSLDSKAVVEAAYQTGQNNIIVDNNLCGDPVPGVGKRLRVVYKKNNQKHIKYYEENSNLDFRDL